MGRKDKIFLIKVRRGLGLAEGEILIKRYREKVRVGGIAPAKDKGMTEKAWECEKKRIGKVLIAMLTLDSDEDLDERRGRRKIFPFLFPLKKKMKGRKKGERKGKEFGERERQIEKRRRKTSWSGSKG